MQKEDTLYIINHNTKIFPKNNRTKIKYDSKKTNNKKNIQAKQKQTKKTAQQFKKTNAYRFFNKKEQNNRYDSLIKNKQPDPQKNLMSKNLTEFFVDLIYEIQKSIRSHLARNWQSFLNLFMPTTFMQNTKAH